MKTAWRLLIGLTLGFTLSIAIAGLCSAWGGARAADNLVGGVLLIVPLWIASLAYMVNTSSVQRASIGLLVANGACYAALWLSRVASAA